MNREQQQATWADLVGWVIWLHDRYELSIEEKLPVCWAQHPGLIEELRALKVWRQEIYRPAIAETGQPAPGGGAVGQAARYWHGELRQVLHAATTQYAAGCRAAHRSAISLADSDPDLYARWLSGDPLTGIPAALLTSTNSGGGGGVTLGGQVLREALRSGDAQSLGDTVSDYIHYDGTWWTPEPATAPTPPEQNTLPPAETTTPGPAGGSPSDIGQQSAAERWYQVTDPGFSSDLDRAATALRLADAAVRQPRSGGENPRP